MTIATGWHLDNLDEAILKFWDRGLDTWEIAKKVCRHESEVYNRLYHLRSAT